MTRSMAWLQKLITVYDEKRRREHNRKAFNEVYTLFACRKTENRIETSVEQYQVRATIARPDRVEINTGAAGTTTEDQRLQELFLVNLAIVTVVSALRYLLTNHTVVPIGHLGCAIVRRNNRKP